MPIHRDLRNADHSQILVKAVGDFLGGGLRVESDTMSGPVCKQTPDGKWRAGVVYDIKAGPAWFSGNRWHSSEYWDGGSRWVISAFTPRDVSKTSDEDWLFLEGLGFPVSEARVGTVESGSDLDHKKLTKLGGAEEEPKDLCMGLWLSSAPF